MKRNLYFCIGILCIVLATILLIKNKTEDNQIEIKNKEIISKIHKGDTLIDFKDQYKENKKIEMPIKIIDGYEYIGYLEIKDLDLNLPIMNNWSYENIRISPARYRGSVYKNDMIILAHNYRAHFGYIHNLKIDSIIQFTDMADNKFIYKVIKNEKIKEDEVEKLYKNEGDLTLFTCDMTGIYRTVIRCRLIS